MTYENIIFCTHSKYLEQLAPCLIQSLMSVFLDLKHANIFLKKSVRNVVPQWRWIKKVLSVKYANTGSMLIVLILKIMSMKS